MWRRNDGNPSCERDDCFIATGTAAVIAGIAAAGGGIAAAKIGSNAAKQAGQVQDAATQRAEVFQRQQAENDFLNAEAARHANYDQYMGRRNAASALGSSIGFNLPDAPAYVPGIDPHYTTAGSAAPSATGAPAQPGQPATGNLDPRLSALYQKYGVTPGARGSGLTDAAYWNDKIRTGDAGYFLGRLEQDLAGKGPDARGASPLASRSIASALPSPSVAGMPAPSADFKLRSINAFLR